MEERRTVVILFAQALGLAERPEAERAALADGLFLVLRGVVERFGGTVDKFIGDVVMALFGAPVAHEDDPARASRAAMEMVREARRFGPGLEMRVGLNRGEVLWGGVGGDRATAMGDPVNVAQRLMMAAEPGSVLAAGAVEELTRRVIAWRRVVPLSLKGRRGEVEAFEAEGAETGRTEVRISPDAAAPPLGREREMRALEADVAAGGRVLVEAAAGLGKSRLLAEMRARLRANRPDARVLVGRCLDGAQLPYLPFAEILRADAAVEPREFVRLLAADITALPGPERERAAHLLAHAVGVDVPGSRVGEIEPARMREAMHAAWAAWFRSRPPALLCIEDLHWADSPTLALLESLAATLPGVAIAATARPGAAAPAGFRRETLGDLGVEAAAGVAERVFGAVMDDALRAFIAEKAGGNPYFVEELARFLRDRGRVEGRPVRLSAGADGIPDGLQGLLVARLDGLDAGDKEALKAASVVGRIFWEGLLARLLGRDPAAALETARRRDMIVAQHESLLAGERQHAFRHALLRDAAYSLLTRKERTRLHGSAADALEARGGGRRMQALAAKHREGAGQPEGAAALWKAAAEGAVKHADFNEALAWAEEAARVAPRSAEAAFAMIVAADAHRRLGRPRDSEQAAARAVAVLGPDAGSTEPRATRLARAMLHRIRGIHLLSAADFEGSLAEHAASGSIGREIGEPLYVAGALANAAQIHLRCGRRDEALRECRDALAIARDRGLRTLEIHVLFSLGEMALDDDRLNEGRAYIEAARALMSDQDPPVLRARALNYLSHIRSRSGDPDGALSDIQQALDVWRKAGDRTGLAAALYSLCSFLSALGRFPEAEAAMRESLALRAETGDRGMEATALHMLAVVIGQQNRFEECLSLALEALRVSREIGDREGESWALQTAGHAHARLGRHEPGLALLRESLQIALGAASLPRERDVQAALAMVLFSAGRASEAKAAAQRARDLLGDSGDLLVGAQILTVLSRALEALGEGPAAQEAREESAAICKRLGIQHAEP